ncbi:hypothetical protein ACWEOH_11105 [Agromyces sp. NPDC004153]
MMDERYWWWQKALSDSFLVPQVGPLVLFVDDDELRKIAPGLNDPAADLARAVRDASSPARGAYFSRVEGACQEWKRGDRALPPPVLPVLALTVLAATRMHSDGQALSTNYYRRLAESIEPEAAGPQLAELRDEVAGSAFLDVVTMWCALDEWVAEQEGRIGVSTIRTHERLRRIGYPQSQALLTRSDRAVLTRFFAALNIGESGLPDEHVMLRALEVWTTANQNRLGETFMAALKNAETKGLIALVVLACAAAWDGQIITRDGRSRIAIRLGIDLEEWTTEWLFPVQDRAPAPIVLDGLTSVDARVSLSLRPPSRYYLAEHAPTVSGELIRQGFRLRGPEFAAEFPKAEVLIFARDPQTGAWSSTAGITPYETHIIAATTAESPAVSRVLDHAADVGWAPRRQGRNPLLPSFTIYENVRFSNDTALQSALKAEPQLRALGVAPTLIPRARFVRGLPVDRELAPNHYLLGGEPDILLPTEEEPRPVILSLNGKEELVMAGGFPFPIRRFPRPEGETEVIADGQKLRFTLHAESVAEAAPKGTAALGWSADGTIALVTENTHILGAVVDGPEDTPPVMCRRGREETWLLLEGGEVQRCIEPGPPLFMHGAGFSFEPAYFEVPASQSARWIAQLSGSTWILRRLTPEMPSEIRASFDVLETWARTYDSSGQTLWALQLGLGRG